MIWAVSLKSWWHWFVEELSLEQSTRRLLKAGLFCAIALFPDLQFSTIWDGRGHPGDFLVLATTTSRKCLTVSRFIFRDSASFLVFRNVGRKLSSGCSDGFVAGEVCFDYIRNTRILESTALCDQSKSTTANAHGLLWRKKLIEAWLMVWTELKSRRPVSDLIYRPSVRGTIKMSRVDNWSPGVQNRHYSPLSPFMGRQWVWFYLWISCDTEVIAVEWRTRRE